VRGSLPTVIIPYVGSADSHQPRDIFVYLRPETNGILVESALLRVIEGTQRYRDTVELAYLANIPGEFIVSNGIVEDHYRYKMPFARFGGAIFTDRMKERFEQYFEESFNETRVVGAFDALEALGLSEEELFNTRVPLADVYNLNCQTVKKIQGIYVVNYDIPALIHKNSNKTDIAVMLFRSTQSNDEFHRMIEEMAISLRSGGIIGDVSRFTRAFHYTKGPFEQVLDARGHLYHPDGTHVALYDMQFCSFLRTKGILCSEVDKTLDNPIMEFRTDDGEKREECLFIRSRDASYQEAYDILISSVSQYLASSQIPR
jgi:hypothetical protein